MCVYAQEKQNKKYRRREYTVATREMGHTNLSAR